MSTGIHFLGDDYSSVQAMPPEVRKAYQSTPIALNGMHYTSVEAMPSDVRAAFEAAYEKDPDQFDDLLGEDDDEDEDDSDADGTAAPAWGGAHQGGPVPVPAEFQTVSNLGPAVEVHPHKGLSLLPKFGTPRASVVVQYRDGLAYRAGDKQVHAWPWEEITVIQTNNVRHPAKDNSWTSHEYTLTRRSGEQVILDDEIKGVWEAAEHTKNAVFALLRPPLKQRYQAGEALAFGPVTIHKQNGLTLDGKLYPWDSIGDVKLEKGQLKVTLQNKQHHAAHVAAIPNFEVLCQLIGVKIDDWELAAEALF